ADDAVAREAAAVIPGRCRRSEFKGTTRDPNHHRMPGRPKVGRPDIEVQAILTGDGKISEEHVKRRGRRHLGRLRAIGESVSHAAPRLNRLWGAEPIGAKWWRCVGNAPKCVDPIGDAATHLAMLRLDNWIHAVYLLQGVWLVVSRV